MSTHPDYQAYPWPVRFRKIRPDIDLAYMDVGTGPKTVIMLHGLGSYSPAWSKTIEGLQEHTRCIALDFPNYGRSTLGNFPVSLHWFAEVVRDLILDLNLPGPIILAGHSMGAQIAIWFHHLQLHPLERLILISPAGFEQFSSLEKGWFNTINRPSLIRNLTDSQILRNFEVNFVQFPKNAEFMVEDRLKLKAHRKAYDFYCRMIPKCTQAMLDEPIWELLPDIRIPTQVIFGLQDTLIPNSMLHPLLTLEQVAWEGTRRIPGAHLTLVPNGGHFVHWEQPKRVNEVILPLIT
ncbi:MAG: alpha/beta hydrolase [Saprospiraceae bacterium]|nr:alpha/beta hydrolase [Saprospiraceae bacterium]